MIFKPTIVSLSDKQENAILQHIGLHLKYATSSLLRMSTVTVLPVIKTAKKHNASSVCFAMYLPWENEIQIYPCIFTDEFSKKVHGDNDFLYLLCNQAKTIKEKHPLFKHLKILFTENSGFDPVTNNYENYQTLLKETHDINLTFQRYDEPTVYTALQNQASDLLQKYTESDTKEITKQHYKQIQKDLSVNNYDIKTWETICNLLSLDPLRTDSLHFDGTLSIHGVILKGEEQ